MKPIIHASRMYRGMDSTGHWRYGYAIENYIYGPGREYHLCQPDTIGASIGVNDKKGEPIYEGDTFEYKGEKFVVAYEPDSAGFVGRGIEEPTYQITGIMLKRMDITGNIYR